MVFVFTFSIRFYTLVSTFNNCRRISVLHLRVHTHMSTKYYKIRNWEVTQVFTYALPSNHMNLELTALSIVVNNNIIIITAVVQANELESRTIVCSKTKTLIFATLWQCGNRTVGAEKKEKKV